MKKKILNIRSDSKDWRGAILANPADTPFRIGKYLFPSVESALQGIKFKDIATMEKVFAMDGMNALRAGREITKLQKPGQASYVHWDEQIIIYNSIGHRLLIAMFIGEKVRQNPKVQQALLETQGTFIYHDVGKESLRTSLPEKFYIQILLSQRALLKKLRDIV